MGSIRQRPKAAQKQEKDLRGNLDMKQFVMGCLFIFVLAGCIPQITPNQSGQPARQQEVEPVDMGSMSLKALFAEYDQNKLVAENKYLGKAIRISGTATNIGVSKLYNGNTRREEVASYHLTLRDVSGMTISCFFEPTQESDILALKEGQKITVYGVIRPTDLRPYPDLGKCRIVKP